MPSAANTALPRYELWVKWRDGREQRTKLRYHEHITIGPVDGVERATLEMGPRSHYPKVVVHLRGDECPAMGLRDLAREPGWDEAKKAVAAAKRRAYRAKH